MSPPGFRASTWAVVFTAALGALIVFGSNPLQFEARRSRLYVRHAVRDVRHHLRYAMAVAATDPMYGGAGGARSFRPAA